MKKYLLCFEIKTRFWRYSGHSIATEVKALTVDMLEEAETKILKESGYEGATLVWRSITPLEG